MRLRPLTLKELNAFVEAHHRHHKPVQGHRFSIGLENDGALVGAISVGRPVSRHCDYREIAEVTRLVTDGKKNACSKLYSAAARAAKAMGFQQIQTYILEDELGTSLRASGWSFDGISPGGHWKRSDGSERRSDQPQCPKQRWAKVLYT